MAAKKENSEEEERVIPVFTVLKSNNPFKNIFLLDNPPSVSQPNPTKSLENEKISDNLKDGEEEVLLVGRHPDCNIMLEHPSISRFHLRIHSKPTLKKLFVIDLSSAHGTWISDRKIEPHVRVELNEGDTLRLGASTRIYRLHWVPFSRAFDLENPFTPVIEKPLLPETTVEEEEEEEEEVEKGEEEEEEVQNENLNSIYEEQKQFVLPSAPSIPENMNSSSFMEQEDDEKILLEAVMLYEKENQGPLRRLNNRGQIVATPWVEAVATESVNSSSTLLIEEKPFFEITNDHKLGKEKQENSEGKFEGNLLSESEIHESPPRALDQKLDAPSLWSRRGKPSGLLNLQTSRSIEKSKRVAKNDAKFNAENQIDGKDNKVAKVLFSESDREEEIFTPDKENFTPVGPKFSKKKGRIEEIRRQKSLTPLMAKLTIDCNQNEEQNRLTFSDKENLTPLAHLGSKSRKPLTSENQVRQETEMIMNKRQVGRVPFQSLISDSPSKSKLEALVATRSSGSVNFSDTIENCTNSSSKNSFGDANRRWNMVVDTSSLLNKDSRKSLQLLQGLKGTCLIIPRMVIRELDCLKRRGTLFRRETEASSVLQWIEECLVTTKWWIHVQNTEEDIPIAPTPPASPRSRTSEGGSTGSGVFASSTTTSVPFSTCGSFMEIVSPTAEDHVLESALLFKRIRRNEQLVLLTNSIALKIKAMAEGLICETVEEFRRSLVNPWSERFLWVESTPRGHTWSCSDEAAAAILREKSCQVPSKRMAKAAVHARGLKLILLHNSHYGQMHSVK